MFDSLQPHGLKHARPPCPSPIAGVYSDLPPSSLVAQRLKHLPPMWETRVWSLGREDPLKKEKATHSSILAWGIPWTEESGGLQSMGSQRVGHDWVTLLYLHWVSDTIQPFHPVFPFSSCLKSFPASESFPMSQFFASCIGVSALASVLPMNIQDWFPLGQISFG